MVKEARKVEVQGDPVLYIATGALAQLTSPEMGAMCKVETEPCQGLERTPRSSEACPGDHTRSQKGTKTQNNARRCQAEPEDKLRETRHIGASW